jgi:cytochrome c5
LKTLVFLALLSVAATPEDSGRKIYTGKCARCHKLYDPTNYDDAAWDKWMQNMKSKAKLNDQQYRQLSEYLQTVREKK